MDKYGRVGCHVSSTEIGGPARSYGAKALPFLFPRYAIMSVNITTPVTGGAQTGFTAPTYTLTTDIAPDINGKQWAVTALGGTQTGVSLHSVSSPFTVSVFRPKTFRGIGTPNPVTGVVSNIPRNTYKHIVRKGMVPLAGQNPQIGIFTITMDVPAGADVASPAEIKAALSLLVGSFYQQSAGWGDTEVSGVL